MVHCVPQTDVNLLTLKNEVVAEVQYRSGCEGEGDCQPIWRGVRPVP